MAEISLLCRRMIEDMTVRNLSPATQRSYLAAVSKFSWYSGRPPIVSSWRISLPSRSTCWRPGYPGRRSIRSCVRCGFLRCDAWPRRHFGAHQLYAPAEQAAGGCERGRGRTLPAGDSKPREPHRADPGLCRQTARVGGGFVEDCRHRQPGMVIRVEQGNGSKDHYVMLSPQLLRILRSYLRLARPQRFPGRDEDSCSIPPYCTPPAVRPARGPA